MYELTIKGLGFWRRIKEGVRRVKRLIWFKAKFLKHWLSGNRKTRQALSIKNMKQLYLIALYLIALYSGVVAQCDIAINTLDEFDSTRLVASRPMNIGYMIVSGNVTEDLEGKEYVEEAKVIFSYSDEKKIRAFFLSIAVAERKFHMIDGGFNVMLKFKNGQIVTLLNAPESGEFNRDVLMWNFLHTCVVPLEVFHLLKGDLLEKVRINYKNYKKTIELEESQQLALQEAVKCVEQQLRINFDGIKP